MRLLVTGRAPTKIKGGKAVLGFWGAGIDGAIMKAKEAICR